MSWVAVVIVSIAIIFVIISAIWIHYIITTINDADEAQDQLD